MVETQTHGGNGPQPEADEQEHLKSELAQGLQQAINGAAGPIRSKLAALELEIESREQELRDLRQLRSNAQRVLYVLDPDSRPTQSKPGPKPRSQKANIAAARVDAVEAWLREHVGPDGAFSAAGLAKGEHGNFDVVPASSASFAIAALRDRGAIRLDHVAGSGGRKYYKLT